MSPSATLIAGVGTLLLALGVGVLIGHDANSNTAQRASSPSVITVGGGGGAAAAAAPTVSSLAGGGGKKSHAKKSGGNSGNAFSGIKTVKALPPPTVTIGGKCASGTAGCQGGKFTGNFFGQ